MLARGIPEEAVKLAEARLAAINAAWDTIRAGRGAA
jgi:DnaJ like chaperone protein